MNARLYLLQRGSALVMAPLVLVHLVMVIFAVRNGLSAEEILGRTRGSLAWGAFYGLFVAAVSLHGAIGLRVILREWFDAKPHTATALAWLIGLGLLLLGLRAVVAVVLP